MGGGEQTGSGIKDQKWVRKMLEYTELRDRYRMCP